MNFEEAEAKFRQLQARVQRGEPISRAEYEDQVSQLAVQDDNGVLWEINPRTGKWMYFDGAEWVAGAPPGHDSSLVVPMPGSLASAAAPSAPPPESPTVSAAPTPKPFTPPPPPPVRARTPSTRAPAAPESVPTYKRTGQDKKSPSAKPSSDVPSGGDQKLPRSTRQGGISRREWIPFAVAAVVLLFCAILVFVGYNVVSPMIFPKATPPIVAKNPTVVNTSVPTIVRLPSPTPIPPTPIPVSAKIISDTPANVRNKPTVTGSTILTKLKKDTPITLVAAGPTDATGNTWYQINLPDNSAPGWIRSDVFQIVSGDPKTLPLAGGAPTATPTKSSAAPTTIKATATLTPIGVIQATPTTKP